jgi:hypothetical protein
VRDVVERPAAVGVLSAREPLEVGVDHAGRDVPAHRAIGLGREVERADELWGAAPPLVLIASDLGNCAGSRPVLNIMSLVLLIAFALATTLPCIALWTADERDRIAARRP